MKLYQKIARVVSQKNTNQKYKDLTLLEDLLPIGNGIDTECTILLKSRKNRIVIGTVRQWTAHQVVITPSFEGEINIRVIGQNENNVKEYLEDIFREALMKEYEVFKKGWEVKDSSEIESELD